MPASLAAPDAPKPRVNAPVGPTIATASPTPDKTVFVAPAKLRVVAVALMFVGV